VHNVVGSNPLLHRTLAMQFGENRKGLACPGLRPLGQAFATQAISFSRSLASRLIMRRCRGVDAPTEVIDLWRIGGRHGEGSILLLRLTSSTLAEPSVAEKYADAP
jgi:hypothetical protein